MSRLFGSAILLTLLPIFCGADTPNHKAPANHSAVVHSAKVDPNQKVVAQALALTKAGKVSEAEALLRSASAADPNSATLHGALGELLLMQHKFEDAVAELGQTAQQMPDSLKYNLLAAEALIGWQRYGIAVKFLEAIEPRFGKDAHFHYDMALAYYYQSNLNVARAQLEEAIRISPNFEKAQFLLANCLVVSGDTPKALAIFRELAQKHPNNAFYQATLGMKLGHMDTGGNTEEALRAVRRALVLEPNNAYVQFSAATVLTQAKQYKEARPLLEHLTEVAPKELEPHSLLLQVYARLGESDLAKAQSEIVEQLQKDAAAQHDAGAHAGGLSSSPQP